MMTMTRPFPHLSVLRAAALLAVTLLTLTGSLAQAQEPGEQGPIQIVGGGQALWVLRGIQAGDPPRAQVILQLLTGDGSAALTPMGNLVGELTQPGVAATPTTLWLIFADGSVQSVRLDTSRIATRPGLAPGLGADDPSASGPMMTPSYFIIREAPLPAANLRPLALAADAQGLWVLAAADAQALAIVDALPDFKPPPAADNDQPPAISAPSSNGQRPPPFIVPLKSEPTSTPTPSPSPSPSPLPATESTLTDESPAPTPAASNEIAETPDAQATPAAAVPSEPTSKLVLLHLTIRNWARATPPPTLTLPEGPGAQPRIDLFADEAGALPTLVTVDPASPGSFVRHRHAQGRWERLPFTMPDSADAAVADLRLAWLPPYLAVAQRRAPGPGLHVRLALVTPEDSLVILGELDQPQSANRPWFLAPGSGALDLIGLNAQGQLQRSRLDLAGQVLETARPLDLATSPAWTTLLNQALLIAILVLATAVLFTFWRKDPRGGQVQLPDHLQDADLVVRALAGAIDLIPPVALALWWFNLDARTFLAHWPGLDNRFSDQLAPALAIAAFIAYSCLAETFFATTGGKALFRLKVVATDGSPPNLWQVLARNVTKAFDLIALLMLLLPLINPHRQRLGDLIARTVVVRTVKPQ
jgi:uncharacterized RDD family membrane protein YckC